jgi:hypothetical protein
MLVDLLKALPNEAMLYPYGSRVYGTATEDSDYDYQIVLRDKDFKKEDWKNKLAQRDFDLHVWRQSEWTDALNDHRVYAMECIHLPHNMIISHGLNFVYKPNKTKLREEFSRVASNSWVKAKKKLIVEADYNEHIAKKSIFHSFRILDFGLQIAQQGRIVNYNSMNHILDEINTLPADWEIIDQAFRERHNKLASEFRVACPK